MLSTEQTVNLIERVARIDANLETLRVRLLGNGQPGELDKLKTEVQGHSEYIVAAKTRSALLGAAAGAVVTMMILLAQHWVGH